MWSKSLVLLFAYISIQPSAYAEGCSVFFAEQFIEDYGYRSSTENFISFLNRLLNDHVIANDYLTTLGQQLESNGQIPDPFQEMATTSKQNVYQSLFQELSKDESLDKSAIKLWAVGSAIDRQKAQDAKIQNQNQTTIAAVKMKFHRIEPGPFIVEETTGHKRKLAITLTNPFEMMSTSVTQDMWKKTMGKLPVKMKQGEDLPLTYVSWWSAVAFANRLSELHGYPPAYNLDLIKNWMGKAEDGTLLPAILRNKDKSDRVAFQQSLAHIYDSKGYRLPTIYEKIFAAKDRGRTNTTLFSGIDTKNMHYYAWLHDPHHKDPHPVAQLLPFMIDGKAFYDLYGNVREWVNEFGISVEKLKDGVDPSGLDTDTTINFHTHIAPDWGVTNTFRKFDADFHSGPDRDDPSQTIGFRLVRTLEK